MYNEFKKEIEGLKKINEKIIKKIYKSTDETEKEELHFEFIQNEALIDTLEKIKN